MQLKTNDLNKMIVGLHNFYVWVEDDTGFIYPLTEIKVTPFEKAVVLKGGKL